METRTMIIKNGKTVKLVNGLFLHAVTPSGTELTAEWVRDSWVVCSDNPEWENSPTIVNMDYLPEVPDRDWMDHEQWMIHTLRLKHLGFDPEAVSAFCEGAYKLDINPLPLLRAKFPDTVWEFHYGHCTWVSDWVRSNIVVVHMMEDKKVFLSWRYNKSFNNNKKMLDIFS